MTKLIGRAEMSAITTTSDILDQALRNAGLEQAFNDRGLAYEDCPGCGAHRGLKLSLSRGRVECSACGIEGPLLAYLREKSNAAEWNTEPYSEADIIPIEAHLPQKTEASVPAVPFDRLPEQPNVIHAEFVEEIAPPPEALVTPQSVPDRKLGERLIISSLALLFLLAGLAAAALSGFANFQAFSIGVTDPMQARVWGWSGVIASVCSFGGFTFFWWHLSGKRVGEALRALVFALAGAGTSIAGTSLYMMNNADGQSLAWQTSEQMRSLSEAEIAEWTRQLEGIPPETRSIAGLEAYLAGVEAAGRTHQKPYRDAQNELGLAQRRDDLESKIASARAELRRATVAAPDQRPAQSLPAWVFALMLEVFSSQATSIAFVSLLLLYGKQPESDAVLEDVVEGLV